MKIETTIPKVLSMYMETEHQKALRKVMHGRDYAYTIPMHTVNMRILVDDNHAKELDPEYTKIKKVIIPALDIYINKNRIKDGKLARNAMEYRVSNNNQPFPLAHVYGDSGYLCLGTIFVPSYVSEHSPQVPLETLFLHNDRYQVHGNPQLYIEDKYKDYIIEYVEHELNPNIEIPIPANVDWIQHDILWRISNYVLENAKTKEIAFDIMKKVFEMSFPKIKQYDMKGVNV